MVWSHLFKTLMVFNWADTLEITIISYMVYRLSQWLGQDKKTTLLPTFYGYCLLTIICYHASLVTITLLLFVAAPILLVSFLLIHQNTLQKNYIAFKRTSSETSPPQGDWLNQVLRSILVAVNAGKPIVMMLENTDSLATLVTCTFPIHAPASHQLLSLLLRSDCYQSDAMLWFTRNGTLMGMNTTWTYELDTTWFDQELRGLETWKQNALFITKKTDALFMYLEPTHHTFTIIAQGIALEQMSLEQTLHWLKKQSLISFISPEKNEDHHVPPMVQKSHQRHTT